MERFCTYGGRIRTCREHPLIGYDNAGRTKAPPDDYLEGAWPRSGLPRIEYERFPHSWLVATADGIELRLQRLALKARSHGDRLLGRVNNETCRLDRILDQ